MIDIIWLLLKIYLWNVQGGFCFCFIYKKEIVWSARIVWESFSIFVEKIPSLPLEHLIIIME